MNDWISVDDRLPSGGKDYLISTGNNVNFDYFNTLVNEFAFYAEDVTHWMPLPPPPKELK
jgi:hypothetical protein